MSEINFSDYLSEDEKRSIIIEEFRNIVHSKIIKDAERIFSNAAYDAIFKIVDRNYDGNMVETIKQKAIEAINGLGSYGVFRPNNAWDKGESKGYTYLQQAVEESKDLIKTRVEEVIKDLDHDDMRALIDYKIVDVIHDKLFGKEVK